jgi:hypothetical protein
VWFLAHLSPHLAPIIKNFADWFAEGLKASRKPYRAFCGGKLRPFEE